MPTRTNEAKWYETLKRWQIKVQQEQERRTFLSSIPGKKGKIAAERKADKWLENKTRDENIRFPKLWEEFLEETKKLTGKSNYEQHESFGRLYLLPNIKQKKVKDITNQDWQNCINAAGLKGLSKKTCQNIRGTITVFYGYAKKRNIQNIRPEDLKIPVNAKASNKKILQPSDIQKLFDIDYVNMYGQETPAFFIHAFRFILLTGLRRGELCGLKKDEDIINNILYVRRSFNKFNEETACKNKNAQRYMVLSEHAKNILTQQEQMLKEKAIISPWLFPDENGNQLDPRHFYEKWKTYRNQHGIECSLHEMRHTMISVAKADVPEQLLKQAVGHSKSMDTFGIYGHKVDGELNRVANILDNIFDSILKQS